MNRQPTPANILDAVLVAEEPTVDRLALRRRLRWDYTQVSPADRKLVEDAAVDILANGQRVQQAMQNASLAIGERLIDVKRLLQHGQFSDWCDQEFGMSQRTAQNLMNIARTFDGKSAEISFLTDSVLALLAAPSTPEPARRQAIEEAQSAGKSPSVARTKEIIAEHRPSAISNQQSPISNPAPATPKQFAAAVKSATWTGTQPDILPPSNAPLPEWAEEPISKPGQSTADYLAYREQAIAAGGGYLNIRDWRQWLDNGSPEINSDADYAPSDDRLDRAQRLITLYRAVINADDEYGALTGRFSDSLAVLRDLRTMIGHLDFLINAITHPEEVSAAD